jgi:hypothetical protein
MQGAVFIMFIVDIVVSGVRVRVTHICSVLAKSSVQYISRAQQPLSSAEAVGFSLINC